MGWWPFFTSFLCWNKHNFQYINSDTIRTKWVTRHRHSFLRRLFFNFGVKIFTECWSFENEKIPINRCDLMVMDPSSVNPLKNLTFPSTLGNCFSNTFHLPEISFSHFVQENRIFRGNISQKISYVKFSLESLFSPFPSNT